MKQAVIKPCDNCGRPFVKAARLSAQQWTGRRFCSQICSGMAATASNADARPPLRDKFEGLFPKGDGCWEWQGTIDGYGYGVVDHNKRRFRAHVLALRFDGRPVGAGEVACHHCDNPRCVRPSHLYPGTAADNARDASVRGRLLVGERHPQAKLTEAKVKAMRSCGLNATDAAKAFGVSRANAGKILERKLWRHVT
jgi:hypothetical protein